jgi:hypothetical protein
MQLNRFALLCLFLSLVLPSTAFAYVDPGSGTMIWQGLFAAIGMVIAFLRTPTEAIRRLIARLRRR